MYVYVGVEGKEIPAGLAIAIRQDLLGLGLGMGLGAHQPRIRQPRRRHAHVDGVYPDLVLHSASNQPSANDRNPRNTKRNQPATH